MAFLSRASGAAAFSLLISMASQGVAQAPSDLGDLVGARGAGGEAQLKARGYDFVRTTTGDDRKWSYWWNPKRQQCVSVATVNGRYDAITSTPAPDCGQAGNVATGRGHHGDDADRDRDRDRGYHPDIGYRAPTQQQQGGSSYADDRRGPVEVGGQRVELGLVCFGDGQRPGVANSYGWTWDYNKDRYAYGNRVEMTREQFDASVMVQFWPGGGRIKLPRKLIPPIHSRGNEDWWDIYNVSMQPDRVTGEYRLNGLNKPRISVDRRSGRISIAGMSSYGFRGTCDLIDGKDHRRF